jgi:iron complex transport system permease protein
VKRSALVSVFLVAAWLGVAALRLKLGPSNTRDPELSSVLLALRGQAVIIASLAGAGLSVAGLLMQGLFRNPLAEPGLIGVGAGANLGGVFAMAFGELLILRGNRLPPELFLSMGCIAGAFVALLILLAVMRVIPDSVTVLLTGVVLTTLFGSIGAVFRAVFAEKWELSRAIMTFSMGDITGKGIRHVMLGAPLVLAGVLAAFVLASHLDLLSSGEDEAATLGVDIDRVRLWTVIWTAILVAAAVAIGGGVPFIGLLVPHLMRNLFGYSHRSLVPVVAIGGALLLLACDCLSVAVDTKSMIPLGGITGLLGAPLFLVLLFRGNARAVWR